MSDPQYLNQTSPPDRVQVPYSQERARDYQAAGWKLVPIPAGQKGPTKPGWNLKQNCYIEFWWNQNIGLAHAYSGTMALDIDDMEMAREWFMMRGIDLQGLLRAPDAVQILSGKPGHGKLIYSMPQWLGPMPTITVTDPSEGVALFEFRCADRMQSVVNR